MTGLPPVARQIGRAVGWKLAFPTIDRAHPFTISHATHYARIDATLPGNLDGGNYRIEIEALNDADFGKIASARLPTGDPLRRPLLQADLTLFWRDRVGDAPSDTAAPKTAVIAVTRIARLAEGVRVKTVIEGRELIYEKLERAVLPADLIVDGGPLAAIDEVLRNAGLASSEFVLHPVANAPACERFELEARTPVLSALGMLGDQIVQATHRRGRSIFLIRDGKLHVGAERPIPFADAPGSRGETYAIDAGSGLISADNQGERRLTTMELLRENATGANVTARDAYQLTMVGRPDVKPGDVVSVSMHGAEVAEFGGFGLPPRPDRLGSSTATREVYVNSVQHRLGKNRGWITTATGVTVHVGDNQPQGVWDIVPAPRAESGNGSGSDSDSADPAQTLVNQVRREVRSTVEARRRTAIGEVRANHQTTQVSEGVVSPAAQSLDLLIGLVSPDGGPRRARRQDVNRPSLLHANIPYLTPFAWGPYGLVLPHYPGERVMVAYHEDSENDPVVLGSLWQTKEAADNVAPQQVQAGDYWLILPAALAASARSSASGTEPVALPSGGDAKAVHDLTDATGARVVQVKELTIRTLPEASLGTPQTRPAAGADGGILITHNNGAKIHIDSNGAITIESAGGQNLTLKAGGDVLIEGQNITLKGGAVDVQS